MDEYTAEIFSGQDGGGVGVTNGEDQGPSSSVEAEEQPSVKMNSGKAESTPGPSLQDRLLARFLQQLVPSEDGGSDDEDNTEASASLERPPFSLPTMTNNFRRFNARIGIVFRFQYNVIKLLSWSHRTQTWSLICVYSFICLDPYLLAVLPFVLILLFIMIPAFLTRHPPPPPSTSTSSTTPYYSYEGPALAPARTIKPAPETSKDFFHNMRDLQNSMADFAVLHDAAVSLIAPATNFSNETLSSSLFIACTGCAGAVFLVSRLLPWRFIMLFLGNALILSKHPNMKPLFEMVQTTFASHSASHGNAEGEQKSTFDIFGYSIPLTVSGLMNLLDSITAISLSAEPEEREVEIFELQHKTYSLYSASPEWEPFLFTSTPYDPLCPSRISGDRPRGSRFFEDVRPPPGWVWKSKKWELDLECREWVMERMVTGVEFEIPDSNDGIIGEEVGGWVWDLPFNPPNEDHLAADILAYTDSWESPRSKAQLSPQTNKRSSHVDKPEWEEATKQVDRAGDWRRRRWVRVVRRMTIDEKALKATPLSS
ncbi:Peroxisome size and maintenance regulator [Microsporum canis]|uniref:Peroxin 24 n=1 Tax=Arthroderma otae (strain ATCC MYA-4605 / CBS 113480) TaxID=554155 RepID=C5FBU3_ARTOC|nr:peroxin 24 [Microsporum canis CBS 113480]EEQ27277.1 peroxin 24 [Microsporum canis CBS 113480]